MRIIINWIDNDYDSITGCCNIAYLLSAFHVSEDSYYNFYRNIVKEVNGEDL